MQHMKRNIQNGRYAERVAGFTQFNVLGIRFSHLTYISNDSSCSSLLLWLTQKFFIDESGKKYLMGTVKVISQ